LRHGRANVSDVRGWSWKVLAVAGLCTLVLIADAVAIAVHDDGPPDGPCGSAEPLAAKEVIDCLADDLAHITTPLGAGSALLLDDGRLITNAHVVDPFPTVDVSFRDGATFDGLAVTGVDLLRDLAVLSPIERSGGVKLAGEDVTGTLAQGDRLFLVGYPGEVEERVLEPSISAGILSQTRRADRFGLTYLQTDAAIGGGQSGGALVDSLGHVLGISGLGFAESFALALTGADVQRGLDEIGAGRGWHYAPTGTGAAPTGKVRLRDPDHLHLLSIAPAAADQRVHFQLERPITDTGAFFRVEDDEGRPLFVPRYVLQAATPEELELDRATYDRLLAQAGTDPNVADFTVPADRLAVIFLNTVKDEGAEVAYSASIPITSHVDADDGGTITPGARVVGGIDSFEIEDTFAIDLAAGQKIDIFVGSPASDMLYAVYPAGGHPDDANIVDDSQEGLYGKDAHETFTAATAGKYVINVSTADAVSTGYVLEVKPG
jgi:hypothetical protein